MVGSANSQPAIQLDSGLWRLDLGFQGRSGVVAAYLLVSRSEFALIETGPASTYAQLLAAVRYAGFDPGRISRALVTHIHLDHSGAAGLLARDNPNLVVDVHPLGAAHLSDPTRLLASASRIYGDQMGPLWGDVLSIPAERVRSLTDGELITIAEREIEVLFTPGHASHHVAYWDREAATVFTGDVGGARMPGTTYVCPPMPPPDLDILAWKASIARLAALGARRWCLSHFGHFDDGDEHIAQLSANIDELVDLVFGAIRANRSLDEITALVHELMKERLGTKSAQALEDLEWATPSYMATLGLNRLYRSHEFR